MSLMRSAAGAPQSSNWIFKYPNLPSSCTSRTRASADARSSEKSRYTPWRFSRTPPTQRHTTQPHSHSWPSSADSFHSGFHLRQAATNSAVKSGIGGLQQLPVQFDVRSHTVPPPLFDLLKKGVGTCFVMAER